MDPAPRLDFCNFGIHWSKWWSQSLSIGGGEVPPKKIQWVIVCSGGKAQVSPPGVEFYTIKYCGSCTVWVCFGALWWFVAHSKTWPLFLMSAQAESVVIYQNEWRPSGLRVNVRIPPRGVILHLSLIRRGHWHEKKHHPTFSFIWLYKEGCWKARLSLLWSSSGGWVCTSSAPELFLWRSAVSPHTQKFSSSPLFRGCKSDLNKAPAAIASLIVWVINL